MNIARVLRVSLNSNQFENLCYVANHNYKQNKFIADIDEVKTHFKDFLDEDDVKATNREKFEYVLFLKNK